MSASRILISSSYYWPEGAGSAPYVTGLAEHLSERGHDVVVITGFAHYPDWRPSSHGRLGAAEIHEGVRIVRRWHYVPRTQSAAHRAAYELSLLACGLTALPVRWRPNAVVGTCPSLAGGVVAAAASARYRVPYGLVFQDLMGLAAEQSGVAGGARVAGIVRDVEWRLARRATAVGIIAENFRHYLESGGVPGDRIERLRNWTRRIEPDETRQETRRRFGWTPEEFVCVHGGNMGQKQGLDNLLETAALLHGSAVRIALVGDGNDRLRLEREAAARKLTNVDFVSLQGPGKWEAVMQAADVLVVNQRASVTDMSLPSKLTSYFAAGRSVVAAASAASETAQEIDYAGAGLVVPPGQPEALRDAIFTLKDDPERARRLGASGKVYAETTLSRAAALAQYDAFISRLVGGRPSG
jgi:colanic acid biosynthesis glycosyl transferase WcaI